MTDDKKAQAIEVSWEKDWKEACLKSKGFELADLDKDIRNYYKNAKDLVPLWFFKALQHVRNKNISRGVIIPSFNVVPGFHSRIRGSN